jgi:hypothetical protein
MFFGWVSALAVMIVTCATGDPNASRRDPPRTEKWEYRWTAS